MAAYTHRNEETEPPTMPGWYWFDGKHIEQSRTFPNQKSMLRLRDCRFGCEVEYRKPGHVKPSSILVNKLKGRWWGPIIPPWEEEA